MLVTPLALVSDLWYSIAVPVTDSSLILASRRMEGVAALVPRFVNFVSPRTRPHVVAFLGGPRLWSAAWG